MNEFNGTGNGAMESTRKWVTLVYAFQAAFFVTAFFTLLLAVILSYVKREDAVGTWLESHVRWQVRTFWFWVLWSVVCFPIGFLLLVVGIGYVILALPNIWLLYRIIKGWLALSEGKPMYRPVQSGI